MRWMLFTATLASVAALAFSVLATRAAPGQASLSSRADDRGGVSGVLSYRAHVVSPPKAHWRAVQRAFAHAHPDARAGRPQALREATHVGVLWALAKFAHPGGAVIVERFSWSGHDGLARSRRHPSALPGSAAGGALGLAPDVLSDRVGQEGALARVSGGHAQLRDSRAHGERHDRVDRRPVGHSGILGMAADRLRIRRVVGEHGVRLAEAERAPDAARSPGARASRAATRRAVPPRLPPARRRGSDWCGRGGRRAARCARRRRVTARSRRHRRRRRPR